MNYTAPEWAFIPNYLMSFLEVMQKNALCIFGGYDYDTGMDSDNGISMLKKHIKIYTIRHLKVEIVASFT